MVVMTIIVVYTTGIYGERRIERERFLLGKR